MPTPKPTSAARGGHPAHDAHTPHEVPWARPNPKGEEGHHALSPQAKAAAKRRAARAGRSYPNLVDNMAVARKAK